MKTYYILFTFEGKTRNQHFSASSKGNAIKRIKQYMPGVRVFDVRLDDNVNKTALVV